MIPGVAGQLLPTAFLERVLGTAMAATDSDLHHFDLHRCRLAQQELRQWRLRNARLGPAASERTLADAGAGPVARILGYEPASTVERAGASLVVDLFAGGLRVPCVVTSWGARQDRFWRDAALAGRTRGSRWVLLFNGTHLRLLDAAGFGAHRSIEFDLSVAADDLECFRAMWITSRASVVTPGSPPGEQALAGLVERADAFAVDVCRSLREGVLTAAGHIVTALAEGRQRPRRLDQRVDVTGIGMAPMDVVFEQALTVVYRILFLLFAESRDLVPTWHRVYRESYSIAALRAAAERGRSTGLWDALRAIGRLAHAGLKARDLSVTPFNGRLFDATRVPLVERRDLDDEAARQAVLALTTRASGTGRGRETISYRDLGVEQLGAVYEALLDYVPRRRAVVTRGREPQAIVVLERGSDARKSSGSFYTPQPIARYLVSRTLEPLVRGRRPDEILSLKVLDPSAGSGAFLVAACQYLSRAYEEAVVAAGGCGADDIGPAERAMFRRLIAERCLYGVDANPMAVQLTRLSLWLITLAWDKPLSFLDHHVRTGDSLVGAWLASLRRPPAPVRRKASGPTPSLFGDEDFAETARGVLPIRRALAEPNDTAAQVREKERALARLDRPDSVLAGWRRVADLWCACWLDHASAPSPASFRDLADVALSGRGSVPAHVATPLLERATQVASARCVFHWELEFPEVFFDASGLRRPGGGFDAIVGNPPWDMMRADTGTADGRGEARRELERLRRFTRDSGVYEWQSDGQANRYQLFLERTVALLRDGGRFGLVLPGGLAMDHGSQRIRRMLFSRCAVDSIVGFDNRKAVFPIHRSVRVMLLTATKGRATDRFGVRFGKVDPASLEQEAGPRQSSYPLELSVDLLERVSGAGLAIPHWKDRRDLTIAERAASLFPALGSAGGWNVRFGRELNASDDRGLFVRAGTGVPVVAGRQLDPFAVHTEAASAAVSRADATRRLGDRWRRPRLAYRDVASATNRLTLIAGLLPPGVVSTHTIFCLRSPLSLNAQHYLCGLFNSFVINYLVRMRVTTHVTTEVVERLPLPRHQDAPAAFPAIGAISRRLHRGSPPNRVDLLAALNAQVANLFQLSVDEFAHVLGTFPLVPQEERDRAMARYRAMV
jgi:N-6 DNA Methylase